MTLAERIDVFTNLGKYLRQVVSEEDQQPGKTSISTLLRKAGLANPWFDKKSVLASLYHLSFLLEKDALHSWIKKYTPLNFKRQKKVAVVMAGNIPLVGFHDFLCGVLSGHKLLVKMSADDNVLLPFIAKILEKENADISAYYEFCADRLSGFDAVIATGSDNTSRYFDYYFGRHPHIIRKNRNSTAVLSGSETQQELAGLADDICMYYGKGCRSVSHVFVPQNYDFQPLIEKLSAYEDLLEMKKFRNNYIYQKTLAVINGEHILDAGFLILKECDEWASPIATLHFSFYNNTSSVVKSLQASKDKIQCVVTNEDIAHGIGFGTSQKPGLSDYADGIDTMAFLKNL